MNLARGQKRKSYVGLHRSSETEPRMGNKGMCEGSGNSEEREPRRKAETDRIVMLLK